ncbi:LysM peptidoglycan-binding domain-containing protein [Maribellus comscasis]|uniref:Peptidoglycan hydrolase n=1 Tax=Maribellus comscasis TaxID=2681766 RepID=A0A6I6JYM2_9BACT|nr:glucosaminidase domain-containing protein [Maribellus comscasis]QGY46268.1 LysM peptidoglycan-binding domain-containing protein [Maribellus comscasis]
MRNIFLFILFIFTIQSAFSQQSRHDYIAKYQMLAIEEMNRSGIPASITMAQACLESGDGNSELARKSNNHFGIKCKSNWKGKKVYHDDDAKNECFRKYKTVEESFVDHTDFLTNNARYSFLFQLDPTDYKSWARGLKKAGYATAGHYDKTLIKIIEDFKLFRLDYEISFEQIGAYRDNPITNQGISNTLTINPYRAHKVINMNNLDAVVAKEGDTYEIIAQEFDLRNWELYKFNDQPKGYVPLENEVIYIENKKRKASRKDKVHRVETGETMHYISQMYGIKLKPLLRRNDMKKGEQPQPGEVIQLRKKVKK